MSSESDLRKLVALSPDEQVRSDAYERSPANIAELRAEIAKAKRPEDRAILLRELDRQTGSGDSSASLASSAPAAVRVAQADPFSAYDSKYGGGGSSKALLAGAGDAFASYDAKYGNMDAAGQGGTRPGDLGRSLKSGVQQLPGQATGLLDVIPALVAGKRPFTTAADAIGDATGFTPGKWAKDTKFSPEYEQSAKDVAAAWKPSEDVSDDKTASVSDYLDSLVQSSPGILAAYLKNPLYTINQVVNSLPGMIAGGVASRSLMTAGRVAGVTADAAAGIEARQAVAGYLERAVGEKAAAPIAAGIGEGAQQTGQQMDQYKGDDQRKNAFAALSSGLIDAAIGAGAGRIANSLGLETAGTAMAKVGDKNKVSSSLAAGKRMLGGAISEGLLQELPQSAQEQVWQNYADNKPLMQGVVRQGVEGAFAGGIMGAGANVRGSGSEAPKVGATDVLAAGSIDDATRTAMLAISGPVTKADREVVDGTLALPGPRAAPTPETLKALPGPDGKPVYMVDAQGNAAVPPAVARTDALNRDFAAQQASDAAAELEQSRRLDLGKQTARGDEPIGKIPVGEVTRFDMLPTGDATEVEQIPAGDATEIAPEVIEPTDLLASDQQPYGNKTSAQAKAFATGGGRVVAIPDHFGSGVPGYVVRPITDGRPANTRSTNASDVLRASNVNQPDVPGTSGVAAGAADGRAPAGLGGIGDLGSRTAADRGILSAAQAPELSSGTAAPTGSGSQPNQALTPAAVPAPASGAVKADGLEAASKPEDAIRRSAEGVPGRIIGSWHPITVTHGGRTQQFLSNIKRVVSDGKTPSTITLLQIRNGRMLAEEPLRPLVYGYRLTRANELLDYGIPRSPSDAESARWAKAFPNATAPVQAPSTSGAVAPAAVAPVPKPKVFKTKQQAQVASKLSGNTQRVKKVSGGFILREASDKELAAAAAAGKRLSRKGAINPDKDSLLTAIAKMGGLAMNEKADTIGEGNKLTAGGHVFTNGGMAIDEMAQQLGEEQGYIPADEMRDGGVRWLRDAIKDEHGGHRQYFSTRGEDWMEKARAEREAQYDDEPLDPLDPFTVDELQESGYISAAPDVQAVTEQMLAEAQELGIDTDTLKEDADSETRGQTDAEFHDHLQAKLRQAISQTRSDAGSTDAGPARASNQGDSQPAGDQGQEGSREGLTLSAQTPADLQAKADREEAAAKAEKAKKAAEQERLRREAEARDNKARADQSVDDFQLGQSAGRQMSGMGDMSEQPAEPDQATNKESLPVAAKPARDDTLIELRKRESVLKSLLDCLG